MKKVRIFAALGLLGIMLASCASGSSSASFGPYSEAEGFYNKENYPRAIEKYQEYLASNPQGNLAAIAEYYVAKSYAASGNAAKARESYGRVVAKHPGTSWAAYAKDQLALLNGSVES